MSAKNKIFVIFLVAGLVFSVTVYLFYGSNRVWQQAQEKRNLLEKRRLVWAELKDTLGNQAQGFRGDAGIIIEDLNTGWQFSLNQDKLFPSASLVKIPIMAACFQAGFPLDEVLLDFFVDLVSLRNVVD